MYLHIMLYQILLSPRCDCGFFATSQIEDDYFGDQTAIPLLSTYTTMDPYTCTWPEGGFNPCKDFCREWASDETDGGFNNLCRRTPEVRNITQTALHVKCVHVNPMVC